MSAARTSRRLLAVLLAAAVVAGTGGVAAGGTATTPEFASSSLAEQRGDVVRIGVRMDDGGSATVDILGRTNGYDATVTVSDDNNDGRVILEFNTYLADTTAAFTTVAPDDSVRGGGSPSVDGMLPAGEYRLRTDDASSIADLTIEPRETKSIATMVAPADAAARLETREDVTAYRAAGNLTARRTDGTPPVATGDTLVLRIAASGLSGVLAVQPGDDPTERFRSLVADDAVGLAVEQTNPGASREAARLLLDRPGVTFVPDDRRDAYYLVVDTDAVHYRRGPDGDAKTGLPLGAEFEATLTVAADSRLATNGSESVAESFRIVERSANVRTQEEAGRSYLAPDADQRVRGTTTLAPGSTVTVTVAADGFSRTRTVTVQPAEGLGTLEAAFDLGGLAENTTVEVTAGEERGPLTDGATTATVRSVRATMDLGDLRTEPGRAFVEVETEFSRGGLVVVRVRNGSGRVVGVEPVAPGVQDVAVPLEDLPSKDTPLVVTAVRDLDGDGRYSPEVDVAYTELDSPRPLRSTILLYKLPPSPTPTPTFTATPTSSPTPAEPTPTATPAGATPSDAATPTGSGPGETSTATPVDPLNVPGFGAGAAAAALLAAAVVVWRRR